MEFEGSEACGINTYLEYMSIRRYSAATIDNEFEEWSKKIIDEFRKGDKIAVISDITLDELEEAPEKVREIVKTIPEENTEILFKDVSIMGNTV